MLIDVTLFDLKDKKVDGTIISVLYSEITGITETEISPGEVHIIGVTKDVPVTVVWFRNGTKTMVKEPRKKLKDQINKLYTDLLSISVKKENE